VAGHKPRRWPRIVLWIVLVLVLVAALAAGGIYLWADYLLGKTRTANPSVISEIKTPAPTGGTTPTTEPARPGSQNILLLGSDIRPGEVGDPGRSDTMMLIHVDPDADYVSVLSLPRDLRVNLGDRYGNQKINAAYAYEGDSGAIRIVQEITGLKVNHYVNVDFEAFRAITTALGGIYVDVDRRYFYSGPDFERVDVQAGYQRIAGDQALQYVRFRHDDNNDYGRIDRQQRFLRAAKEQALNWSQATKIFSVVSLLAEHVKSDLSTGDAFNLSWWGVRLGMGRVKQVKLATSDQYIGGVAYALAGPQAMQAAVDDLLAPPAAQKSGGGATTTTGATNGSTGTTAGPPPGQANLDTHTMHLSNVSVEVYNASGKTGAGTTAARILRQLGANVLTIGDAPEIGYSVILAPAWTANNSMNGPPDAAQVGQALGVFKYVEDNSRPRIRVYLGADYVAPAATAKPPTFAEAQTAQWHWLAAKTTFPLMAPSYLPAEYSYAGSRIYDIDTEKGPKPALKVMYRYQRKDQFLGLMQTTFVDAPIASPGEQVKQNDLTFTVVQTGAGVDHVWWKKDGTLYWVSNTQGSLLSRAELLGVAASMAPVK
jgi:LCP family protein required for cell wall assembly